MDLRLTRRALNDLALPASLAGTPAKDLVLAHPLVDAFVERRSQSPTGQEAIQLPVTRATAFSLHADRWRGLTWHDQGAGVVWLLGAGYHRSGDRSDVYAVLKARDAANGLFPTEQDYLDLEPDPVAFVDAIAVQAPDLMRSARATLGREVRATLADAIDVCAYVDGDAVSLAFAMPPHAGAHLPPDYLMVAIAALLPEADVEDVAWGSLPHRSARANEICVTWRAIT